MENEKTTAYKYQGVVHQIGKTQTFASGFAKRLLVCKSADKESKYPNYAVFEFTKGKGENAKDRTADLNKLGVGDEVEVSFFLDARENPNTPGQWFASNRATKVEVVKSARPAPITDLTPNIPEVDEDMPF